MEPSVWARPRMGAAGSPMHKTSPDTTLSTSSGCSGAPPFWCNFPPRPLGPAAKGTSHLAPYFSFVPSNNPKGRPWIPISAAKKKRAQRGCLSTQFHIAGVAKQPGVWSHPGRFWGALTHTGGSWGGGATGWGGHSVILDQLHHTLFKLRAALVSLGLS